MRDSTGDRLTFARVVVIARVVGVPVRGVAPVTVAIVRVVVWHSSPMTRSPCRARTRVRRHRRSHSCCCDGRCCRRRRRWRRTRSIVSRRRHRRRRSCCRWFSKRCCTRPDPVIAAVCVAFMVRSLCVLRQWSRCHRAAGRGANAEGVSRDVQTLAAGRFRLRAMSLCRHTVFVIGIVVVVVRVAYQPSL